MKRSLSHTRPLLWLVTVLVVGICQLGIILTADYPPSPHPDWRRTFQSGSPPLISAPAGAAIQQHPSRPEPPRFPLLQYVQYPEKSQASDIQRSEDGFSMCLMVRDDGLDGLAYWIAYHYHLLRLQYLVVYTTPDIRPDAREILQSFRTEFDIQFQLWQDSDIQISIALTKATSPHTNHKNDTSTSASPPLGVDFTLQCSQFLQRNSPYQFMAFPMRPHLFFTPPDLAAHRARAGSLFQLYKTAIAKEPCLIVPEIDVHPNSSKNASDTAPARSPLLASSMTIARSAMHQLRSGYLQSVRHRSLDPILSNLTALLSPDAKHKCMGQSSEPAESAPLVVRRFYLDWSTERHSIVRWLPSFLYLHGPELATKVLDMSVNRMMENKPSLFGMHASIDMDSTSACLLIKDDNDILSEWLAYHYHVLKLRTLIVAVDPSSETSPEPVLKRWVDRMEIVLWSDADFMPKPFLKGNYHFIPNLLSKEDKKKFAAQDEMSRARAFREINVHRYRQQRFISKCISALNENARSWAFHIDTDEYIVIHPDLRENGDWEGLDVPQTLEENSVLGFLKNATKKHSKQVSYPCVSMPRLLYGSKEDSDEKNRFSRLPEGVNGLSLETTRWKYHSNYDEDLALNGKPKVIMDLSGLPRTSKVLDGKIFSIHRPALTLCWDQDSVLFEDPDHFPLTVQHYIGSWERYNQRQDARRSRKAYNKKALVDAGKDDDWIDSWVASFVRVHGYATAMNLLGLETSFSDEASS
eukprot:Nitzschia sp. Nitz4//scaffold109_size72162//313//2568//NITZ4_005831-RA/size72162-processed-gene-0.26-mRNA-1//-1//CDS//3329532718//4509//frame0